MRGEIFSAVVLTAALPLVSSASSDRPLPFERITTIHLKLSDLRSAYLLRAGIVRYDATANTPEGVRAQIQRHFDTVIGLLLVSTGRSINTLLARLEAADDHPWSDVERAEWKKQLLSSRYLQLQRLAFYRDRGRFPWNEGQSLEPAPIFVDQHDTACAVGQLMRWSGWVDQVADIQHRNNLIYVPDAAQTAVAAWVLTSGITLEEAALIQPGYLLVATNPVTDYGPGKSSFVSNGLKYQNFHFSASNYTSGISGFTFHQALNWDPSGSLFVPTLSGPAPDAQSEAFNAGLGTITTPFFDIVDPPGNRWLLLGGATSLSFAQPCPCFPIGGQAQAGTIQKITLSFDVSTINPNTFIDEFGEYSNPSYGGFNLSAFSNNNGQFEVTTAVKNFGIPLGSAHFEEIPSGTFVIQDASAALATKPNSISVTSTIWLYNGATLDSFVLGFNLVPEPASLYTVLLGLIGAAFSRSIWRRY